ncbi:MAG: carboxypeptidase regulatory-like domain-containing protein [Fimbriimonas sp.]
MATFVLAALLTLATQNPTVQGKLLDPGGKPIGGTTVHMITAGAWNRGPVEKVKTDAQGRFRFKTPPMSPMRGSTTVYAQPAGLGMAFANWLPNLSELTLEASPATTAVIPLQGPDGKPLVGVSVAPQLLMAPSKAGSPRWLALPEALRKSLAVRTDAQGQARLTGLPQGYECQIDVLDERYVTAGYRDRFRLASAATSEIPPISLRLGATVTGQVLLNGKGVPGIQVGAQAIRSEGGGDALTDAQGRFRLTQLAPGNYNVALGLSGKWEATHTARAHEVNLEAGAKREGLVFTLETGALITGKVTGPDGKPAASVPVGIYGPAHPQSGGWVQSSITGADGVYRHRVPAGDQYLYVMIQGGKGRNLSVKDGEKLTVDLQAPAPPQSLILQGRVLDPEGKPVPGAVVRATTIDSRAHLREEVETDAQGRFRIEAGGDASGIRLDARKGDLYMAAPAEPAAKGDTDLRTVRGGLAHLRGLVRGPDGKPVANAAVRLIEWTGGTGSSVGEIKTKADGTFEFAGLLPNRAYSADVRATGLGRKYAEQVSLKRGDRAEFPPFDLVKADQSLGGRIVDEKGQPVAGVEVTAHSEEISVTTDAKGRFRLDGLPKGSVSVGAYKGNRFLNRSFEAGRLDLELVLKPAGAAGDDDREDEPAVIAVGAAAPELEVTDWENAKPTTLQALRGKVVVIDFWAIWCGPCREGLPKVNALAAKYKDANVAVIGLHDSSTWPKELKEFATKNAMTYPLAIDREADKGFGKTATRYGVSGIPTLVVIDPTGKVASVSHDVETAEATVERLLKAGK